MSTRIASLIRRLREKKLERTASDYGHLSERERHEVDRLREEHRFGNTSVERESWNRPGT